MKKASGIFSSIALFILFSVFIYIFREYLIENNVDVKILMGANLLMFCLSAISHLLHLRASKNPNPNVLVRSIMGATSLKLFVLAAATIVYLFFNRENPSIKAIFIGMAFYVVYTVFDVKFAMQLNSRK